jgi:hypothetical protein
VRKGTTYVFIVGAAAIIAWSALRSCSDKPAPVAKTPASAGKSGPRPIASGRRAKVGGTTPAASVSAASAAPAGDGRVVFFSPWGGSQKDQLGRERPQEGNPMGPMSLAHDAKGRIYVLDQVNQRIVRRGADGSVEGTFDMKLTGAQDIAVAKSGEMAVLDRVVDKTIAIYDANGDIKAQLPLEGEGIEEPGHVTGVFVDGSDVYVEREHGPLVKIGDLNGTPAEPRTEIPGRPTRDGLSFINAGITDGPAGRAYVASVDRQSGEHRFTREIRFKSGITSILLLDTDKSGTIYFAVELHEDPAADYAMLQCLEPTKGVLIGSAMLPVNTLPEETFRDLTVLDDGGVVYAVRSEEGVTYRRFDCGN